MKWFKKASSTEGNVSKKNKKLIMLVILAIGNIATMLSLSLAWFLEYASASSQIDTFSGDMDVVIEKVSAYKYVYPYISNSAEFIDYDNPDNPGVVKSYVVEDASIEVPNNLSNTVTFQLGVNTNQSRTADPTAGTGSKIHFEKTKPFNYYLVGNSVFTGVSNNPWSSLTATAFSRADAPEACDTPTDSKSVILTDVMVSAGAEFMLFDANTLDVDGSSNPICSYFTYGDPILPVGKNSRFSIVNGHLKCLKSGVYDFRYRFHQEDEQSPIIPYLDITLTASGDSTIMASNLVDPTKISIDYNGGTIDKATYSSLASYLATGIQAQNTMVVLDVYVKYQNKNDIDAGLKIVRDAAKAYSISSFDGKYNTSDSYTFLGYKNAQNRNPLCASDFYSFYSELMTSAHATSNGYDNPTTVWNAFNTHKTDYTIDTVPAFNKYSNAGDYETDLECTVYGDSTVIAGAISDNYYHIYIAIDYDYEHMNFFVHQDRLGKTYALDRDFHFFFTATQHLEEDTSSSSSSSSSSSEGGGE